MTKRLTATKARAIVIIFTVVAAFGLHFQLGAQPDEIAADSKALSLLEAGIYDYEINDYQWVDSSRPTQATDDFEGSDVRELTVRVWSPKGAEKNAAPLMIYSHGFLSSREGGSHLGEHLASHGYVVAAADFPLTSMNSPGTQIVKDVAHQPGDVSFIIDKLLEKNASEGDELASVIDAERIGAMGLSLGGMTTVMAAYHPRYYDARIKTAISIAGPTSMFGKTFFAHRDIPFLMIASEIDAMVDYGLNAADISARINNASLVNMKAASHAGFSYQARALRFLDNPDSVGCWALTTILGNVEQGENWLNDIGSADEGIVEPKLVQPCTAEVLPPAMNVLRQQELETIVIFSFLQNVFFNAQDDYLALGLVQEFTGVSAEGPLAITTENVAQVQSELGAKGESEGENTLSHEAANEQLETASDNVQANNTAN